MNEIPLTNQLRRKNYIAINQEAIKTLDGFINYPSNVFLVDKITETHCDLLLEEDRNLTFHASAEDLLPIPLTEDWLLKFGFEHTDFGEYVISIAYLKDSHKYLVFDGHTGMCFIREYEDTPLKADIVVLWNQDIQKQFYVHELQNLFFALTKKELEIEDE